MDSIDDSGDVSLLTPDSTPPTGSLSLTPPAGTDGSFGYQPPPIQTVPPLQLGGTSPDLGPLTGPGDGFTPSPEFSALDPEYANSLTTPNLWSGFGSSTPSDQPAGMPMPGFLQGGYLGNCIQQGGVVVPGVPGSFMPRFDNGGFPNMPSGLDFKMRF